MKYMAILVDGAANLSENRRENIVLGAPYRGNSAGKYDKPYGEKPRDGGIFLVKVFIGLCSPLL